MYDRNMKSKKFGGLLKEFGIGFIVWLTLYVLVVIGAVGYSAFANPQYCKNRPMMWDPEIPEQYDFFGQAQYYQCSSIESFVYMLPFTGFYILLFSSIGPLLLLSTALTEPLSIFPVFLISSLSIFVVIPVTVFIRYLWNKRR